MMAKTQLLEFLKHEFPLTLKVIRAFPAGNLNFKPHERSSSAKRLISTFVFEMILMQNALGRPRDPEFFKTYNPKDTDALAADFEKESAQTISMIEAASDADLEKEVPFGKWNFPATRLITMLAHDQIHHRGQLSVYIRMAGGKVPAIYGPSADDADAKF